MIRSPIILSKPLSPLHHSFLAANTVIRPGGASHTNAAFINQPWAKNEKKREKIKMHSKGREGKCTRGVIGRDRDKIYDVED